MTRIATALSVAATITLLTATQVTAGEPPKEVLEWLTFCEGTWELRIKGDDDAQPGIRTAELAAGGTALVVKGKHTATGEEGHLDGNAMSFTLVTKRKKETGAGETR